VLPEAEVNAGAQSVGDGGSVKVAIVAQ
jgi:hypothetical protein